MTEPEDPRGAPLGLELARTGRLVSQAFDRALAEHGGSLPVWQVLVTLRSGSGRLQRAIAEAIGIESATLTHHLNRMERDGLVIRRRAADNRRTHIVELTDDGVAMFHRLLEGVIAFDTQLRAGLGADDLAALHGLLARVRTNCTELEEVER